VTAPGIDLRLRQVVDQFLGRPFAWGARGPESFYCLGLYLYLLEEVGGVSIPDPFIQTEEIALRNFWERFIRLASTGDLRPLDILFWRWADGRAHVATVEDGRWAVTTTPGTGVHRMPLGIAAARAEAAYRPKELVA
jgi:cell wall-associated NlpC family hydrolase